MKKKAIKLFFCQSCGQDYPRWAGKCDSCGKWNTILEESGGDRFSSSSQTLRKNAAYKHPIPITSVPSEDTERILTGLSELDLVLGGGLVPGSLVLIGGEPGVGKSTLILEISRKLSEQGRKLLYISGEESASQVGLRAARMSVLSSNLLLSSETYAENVSAMIEDTEPDLVFVDSIQTLTREALPNQAGTVTQLRECTQVLLETAKRTGIPIIMTGHITKDGTIAGPKILEHLVDTVLYFEGDRLNYFRLLRAVKNRFGSVGDLAVFEMLGTGLREVKDRHHVFISSLTEGKSGSVISAVLEGSRALSVEVQALVSRTNYSQARRMAEGPDTRRVILLAAVIEKYLGHKLSECDIFGNLAGGLQVDEPALDLAICASILSSYTERPVKSRAAVLGEVGLSGEVRSVGQISLRLKELKGIGMETVYIPEGNLAEIETIPDLILVGIKSLSELEGLFR
ncbi:DNA repair protein RadA [Leptospira broomii serovar Hurstbridge str. 5399]|uniref:DNA repair protein RadA n=1 Tax=Leptospira broomii serovar Hurstbridge str. 5399 TaxID=1049789 RepID=T0F4U7_9LEPT|nr:DNA repair protein RadA [Leptospira broomii]EQA46100.1 DNA repair protein RadA [Leptospira broomii serovar Hurstbridge str. 5399]